MEPLERLDVDAMGTEKKADEDWFSTPKPSRWRMNLTALSQYYNLFFVAFGTEIHVFEPVFPFQKLGNKPKLVLHPPMARPWAPGYIDWNDPHSINHLIVGDLGNDEILLLCTDSGNVAAYSTKSVRAAIDKGLLGSSGIADGDVQAFFSQAVVRSAWGLAIHRTARMIAVSCNATEPADDQEHLPELCNAKVTIFAFSLVRPNSDEHLDGSINDEDSFDDIQQQEWFREDSESNAKVRNKNIILRHTHHQSNIPSIAFLNDGQDPYGEWILSTDIYGNMLATRVFDGLRGYVEHRFGKPRDRQGINDASNDRSMGWSVTALSPSCFHEIPNIGFADPRHAYMENIKPRETSHSTRSELGSGDVFLELGMDLSEDEDQEQGMLLVSDSGSDFGADDHERFVRGTDNEPNVSESEAMLEGAENELEEGINSSLADRALERINDAEHNNSRSVVDENSIEISNFPGITTESDSSTTSSSNLDDSDTSESPGQGYLTDNSQLNSSSSTPEQPRGTKFRSMSTTLEIPLISCPVLHTTNYKVSLLNLGREVNEGCYIGRPFQRYYSFGKPIPFNRMNLISYLPELGIVVVGTQAGRVALLVLTRNKEGTKAFRAGCVLPTQKQFENDDVPQYPLGGHTYPLQLLGIATAPLQGTESPPDVSSSPSEEVWASQHENSFETSIVEGVRRSYESKILILPSTLKSTPNDGPKSKLLPKPVPKDVQDLKDKLGSQHDASAYAIGANKGNDLDRKSARRYRLMLYFFDHTVLSYEIGWS